jgi:hypothetical protein
MSTAQFASSRNRALLWLLALLALVVAAAVAALVGRSSATAAPAASESQALRSEVASLRRDARFWRQLSSAFTPGKSIGLNSMADHTLLRLPGGLVMALHFDNMNLSKAKNLNWVALAVPGKFTRADQARVNRLYGPGFTHFHNFKEDAHAGPAGMPGVWFVHVGTRNFTSPFGKVKIGRVDRNFMPTRPPR